MSENTTSNTPLPLRTGEYGYRMARHTLQQAEKRVTQHEFVAMIRLQVCSPQGNPCWLFLLS
jgi:hypothetical protein